MNGHRFILKIISGCQSIWVAEYQEKEPDTQNALWQSFELCEEEQEESTPILLKIIKIFDE